MQRGRNHKASGPPLFTRPAAAGGLVDQESATEPDDPAKARAALDAMRRRGLIDEAEYQARIAAMG